ncbi:hypothetical protein IVB34_15715 [Bradyrhizobium sp. 2]|uniref:hypothetical protein n=1 Tax=Bradyrhizobium sp. 2 TaxID=190045 RepID=UPI001FFA5D40|nr:hypothetical protein [Bradyrhizobium sp. 2]MCK1459789.1 hypothetical protein [Bradyrhizobium sp. 2]
MKKAPSHTAIFAWQICKANSFHFQKGLKTMTLVMNEPGRQEVALLWLTTGLGSTVYGAIQSFTFVNRQIDGLAPAPAFDAAALWFFAILSSLWIVVGLFALVGRRRVTKWGSFILGGFLVAISTAGGVFDGIRDGLHIAATVLLAVTLPGFFAIRASWRLLRLPGHAERRPNGVSS